MRDERLPLALFALAVIASGVLISVLQSSLTSFSDEWYFLLGRRDFDPSTFLEPHNEHVAILHVAIYKGVLGLFGMESARPFQAVGMAMFLLSAVLVFVFVRRRVGAWAALALTLPVLFFGPATDNLIWPFQLAFSGSIAAGIGALLMLERGDRRGDLAACGLLVVSLSFSSAGIPFAAGVVVAVLLGPRPRHRAWVPAVPIALFALWWLTYGHEADTFVTLKNVLNAPSFALDGIASSLASLVGLATASSAEPGFTALDAGRPLLVVAAGFAGWRLWRLGRVPAGVWVALALLVSFWGLTALNANVFRVPVVARYQLMGAIFIIFVAAELLRGTRFSRTALAVIMALALLAVASNLETMRQQWRGFEDASAVERGALSAVEIGREQIDPDYVAKGPADFDIYGNAGLYLAAADESGSPSFTPDELTGAPAAARIAADRTFADAYPIGLEPLRGTPPGGGTAPAALSGIEQPASRPGCLDLRPDEFGNAALVVPAGGVTIAAAPGVLVAAQRYASNFPLDLGEVERGQAARLEIPPDASGQPWALRLSQFRSATVCGAGA